MKKINKTKFAVAVYILFLQFIVCNRNSKREECKGAHPFVSVTVCHNLGCCFDYSIPRNGLWCYSAVEEEKENEEETETENQGFNFVPCIYEP